jgi:hypothetical protein
VTSPCSGSGWQSATEQSDFRGWHVWHDCRFRLASALWNATQAGSGLATLFGACGLMDIPALSRVSCFAWQSVQNFWVWWQRVQDAGSSCAFIAWVETKSARCVSGIASPRRDRLLVMRCSRLPPW